VFNGIKSIVKGAFDFIMGFIQPILDAAGTVMGAVSKAASGDVVGAAGDLVGGLGKMLGLAEGGVVAPKPGGTVVRVAEAGEPEIVSPLSKVPQILSKLPQFSRASTISNISAAGSNLSEKTKEGGIGTYINGDVNFIVEGAQDTGAIMRDIYGFTKQMGWTK